MITEEMYGAYADYLGVEPAALKAVVDVESLGYGFEGQFLVIRWEGHKFRKFLKGEELARAERAGLAYTYANRHKHPQPRSMEGRDKLLMQAMAINEDAALMSISMGMGQVMGFHYKKLGFKSPQEMFDVNNKSLDGQLRTMVRFIESFDLKDELQKLDWVGFASGYNGINYKVNNYDTKLEKAYRKHGGRDVVERGLVIKIGAQGKEVTAIQKKLQDMGYPIKPDGMFGAKTKKAVQLFQANNAIMPDGIVGNKTFDILDDFIPEPICETQQLEELKKTSPTTKMGRVVKATGGSLTIFGIACEGASLMDGLDMINRVSRSLEPISNMIKDNLILFFIALGVTIFILGHRFVLDDLKEKIKGKKL